METGSMYVMSISAKIAIATNGSTPFMISLMLLPVTG